MKTKAEKAAAEKAAAERRKLILNLRRQIRQLEGKLSPEGRAAMRRWRKKDLTAGGKVAKPHTKATI